MEPARAMESDLHQFIVLLDSTDPSQVLHKFVAFAASYLTEKLDIRPIGGPWSEEAYAFRLTHQAPEVVDFQHMAREFAKVFAPHLNVRIPLPRHVACWPSKAFFSRGWLKNMLEDRHSQSVKKAITKSMYAYGMRTLACYFAERSFQFEELKALVNDVKSKTSTCTCVPKKIFISCWLCDPQY